MVKITIRDIIPQVDSAETDQSSEPSLAIDPLNPNDIIAGAFTDTTEPDGSFGTDYFLSTDGGVTWTPYGSLGTDDKSLAWSADGTTILTATLTAGFNIATYSGSASGTFGSSPINTFAPANPDFLDQPWIRIGPSNHIYVAYNNLNNTDKTASVNVSTNGGSTFTPVVIDKVGGTSGQDAPSVRVAVSGNTVYAGFTRWNATIASDANGNTKYASQVVVVRSDNGGSDAFGALGTRGVGTVVATPTGSISGTDNGPLALGQERTASAMAIAVDPNNANRVIIAYSDASGALNSGHLQLIVAESTDGGVTWTSKFTTSLATRSDQPALAISTDGTVGFLYDNYDPTTNELSQHFVSTSDDFATTTETVLASERNTTPTATSDPYLGDFFDLQAVGTSFDGVFSASNDDNGTAAQFANVTFQRDFTGTPGTSSFQLTNSSN